MELENRKPNQVASSNHFPYTMVDNLAAYSSGKPSFDMEKIEPDKMLFAGILKQSCEDSRPSNLFVPRSKESIFNSCIPDAFDAYDFFNSNRFHIYANLIGLDEAAVYKDWRDKWLRWKELYGEDFVANLVDHVIHLLKTNRVGCAVYMDAKSFYQGPHFNHWAMVAGKPVETLREYIAASTEIFATEAYEVKVGTQGLLFAVS